MNAAPFPAPMTRTVRVWDVETGIACACSKATRAASGAWRGAPMNGLPFLAPMTRRVRLWDVETGRCLRVLEGHTNDSHGAWRGAPMNGVSFPAPVTRPYGCGTWRRGAACCVSRAHVAPSGAWHGAPMNASLSPAPVTRPCGCGTWRRGAACACSKATRSLSRAWRGAPMEPAPSPATKRAVSGCGICRNSSPEARTHQRPRHRSLPLTPDQVQYTNAKVLLVGDSGVGQDRAFHAAGAERVGTQRLDRRRLGHTLEAASVLLD